MKRSPARHQACEKIGFYIYAVFRPIEECASLKQKGDVSKVRSAFIQDFHHRFADSDDAQVLEEAFPRAVAAMQRTDLWQFDPAELRGIGPEYKQRWRDVIRDAVPRHLIENRIQKAKAAITDDARLQLDADYPSQSTDRYISDPTTFLHGEVQWFTKIEQEVRRILDDLATTPSRIGEFERGFVQHRKECSIQLNHLRTASTMEDCAEREKLIESCKSKCNQLARHGQRLRAQARSYLGINYDET